jgi:TatD DNase family protein
MTSRVMVDTHTHLGDPVFDPDRAEVILRAQEAGVRTIIAVSENLRDAGRNLTLSSNFDAVRPAAGLYPTHLDPDEAGAMIAFIKEHRERWVAIGEVGLDFWAVKDEAERALQREIFSRFVDLALELDLPLNVHSRSAGRHAVRLLLDKGARRVQLHAFDGKAAAAMPGVEAGYFFSIPPSVVRSRQKQKLVGQLPLSCLLLETDSPVLGPNPEERNEPANIRVALEAIAELKGMDPEALTRVIAENTARLYGDLL